MKRNDQLFLDVIHLAELGFESLTEHEIQEWYGSDYYVELRKYLKSVISLKEQGKIIIK